MNTQSPELEIAETILAANLTVVNPVGPGAVRRLEVDRDDQLVRLTLPIGHGLGLRGIEPGQVEGVAVGFSRLAVVTTWHPDVAGATPSVAQVLAQLDESVRQQVTGVQFLGREGETYPVTPGQQRGYLRGWAQYRVCLYRDSIDMDSEEALPLTLPGNAFDETGTATLYLNGAWTPDGWIAVASAVRRGAVEGVEPIGVIWTDDADRAGDPDDVLERLRRWIVAELPKDLRVKSYRCLNLDAYGPGERDGRTTGLMVLTRVDAPDA